MPYQWIKPELVFSYFGVSIFRTYRRGFYVDPYQYNFTTCDFNDEEEYQFDARELGEWHEYIAAHGKIKEGGTYENHMHNVIKMAIEHQTLNMPVPDADYPDKRGSFDWYTNHPNSFMKSLSCAVMQADMDNKAKLDEIYRHMILSNSSGNWSKVHDGSIVDAPIKPYIRTTNTEAEDPAGGCFFWYLKRSGSFVTHMANAISFADEKNLEIIRQVYPQMVAAYERINWNDAPDGFSKVYSAGHG